MLSRQTRWKDATTEKEGRHQLVPSLVQKAVKQAFERAGLTKTAARHALRQLFATHLFERGQDMQTILELMGQSDLNTTLICVYVLKLGPMGVISAVDHLYLPP